MSTTSVRKDSWTENEDLILAEIVLTHIRKGSTQTNAFQEVAEKLNRTVTACSVRWNTALKLRYDTALQIAKKAVKRTQPIEKPTQIVSGAKTIEKVTKEVAQQKKEEPILQHKQKDKQEIESGTNVEQEELEKAIRTISYHLKKYVNMSKEDEVHAGSKTGLKELQRENQKLQEEIQLLKEENKTIKEDCEEMAKIFSKAKQMIS